jgi:NitT/TauT family transport system ATP-binding protein
MAPSALTGPTKDCVVELTGITKTFANGVTAIQDFDLKVESGQFLSLLGPSGCGKSTVLRLIAGLLDPSSGTVSWPAGNTRGRQHRLGFVFQDATLMPWADAAANVALPLKLGGMDKPQRHARARDALERVGLGAFERSYPRELSGGMRMRVSIARALVTQPAILLMDEPFAALDEITRFKLNDDLLALWQSLGMTVIFVTHSVFESAYLSSRIAVMTPHPGRIDADLSVDAPYPRDAQFRTSAEYAATCRRVSHALAAASEKTP